MKSSIIKILSLLLAAVILVSAAACGKNEPDNKKTEKTADSIPEISSDTVLTSEIPPETTVPVTTEDPNLPKPPEVLYRKYKDYNNAFVISGEELGIPKTDDYMSGITAADMNNGIIAFVYDEITEYWDDLYGKTELTLFSYDLQRGIKLGQTKIEGIYAELCILESGEIALGYKRQPTEEYVPNENFEIAIFNTDLSESTVTKLEKCNGIDILRDGTTLIKEYCEGYDFPAGRIVDVRNPWETIYQFDTSHPVFSLIKNEENYILLELLTAEWTSIGTRYNKESGEFESVSDSAYSIINLSESLFYDFLESGWFVKNINSDSYIYASRTETEELSSDASIMYANNKYFIVTETYENGFMMEGGYGTNYYIYNSENGKFVSELVCDDGYMSNLYAFDDGNNALIVVTKYDDDRLFNYDLILWCAGKEEKDGHALKIETLKNEEIDKDIARIAAELSGKVAINIYYDEESLESISGWDYKCHYSNDKTAVLKMLLSLVAHVNDFPYGFFDDIRRPGADPLSIYFSGRIEGVDSSSISYAAALTGSLENGSYICFDVNEYDYFTRNLAHELMHVVDGRITDFCYDNLDFRINNYWTDVLNDGPYDYYYSYHDENGYEVNSIDGTIYGDDPPYYADAYSKTFPTEDKSRIFEHLFVQNNYVFDEGTPLTRKAEYLIAMLRYVLPSVGACEEECVWEKLLGIHTMDEFDVFK